VSCAGCLCSRGVIAACAALDAVGLLKGKVGLSVSFAVCIFLHCLLFWETNLGNRIHSLPSYE